MKYWSWDGEALYSLGDHSNFSDAADEAEDRMMAHNWIFSEDGLRALRSEIDKELLDLDDESNLIKHAFNEFRAAGWLDDNGNFCDDMQEHICMNAVELLRKFSEQGHSGSSAPYLNSLLNKLMMFEPITPLKGTDDEWVEVAAAVWQNKRCSHVFKQSDRFGGQAYDINGRVFREPNGTCYTSGDSLVPITFPYTPTVEYVDVQTNARD